MNQIEIKIAKSDSDFVGIECINNKMVITFPVGYDIQPCIFASDNDIELKNYHSDIKALLKILQNNSDSFFNEGVFPFNFSAAIYLINDYFKNGLMNKYKYNTTNLNTNNINWQKTIETKIPFYSKGNFVYLDKSYKNIERIADDITNIQKYCLHKAFLILKIFYHNYDIENNFYCSKEEMLYKIKIALNETNIDENKKRLTMMQNFIKGTSFDTIQNNEIKIGTYHFDKKWEELLRNLVKRRYKLIDVFPQASYVPIKGEIIKLSRLIPDIIFEDENYIYIIDAKYYKIGSLPQTSDISKQLIYAMYIRQKVPNKAIKNIFLLPNIIEQDKTVSYYGYATMKILEEENSKVQVYYIDIKDVIQKY